MADHRQRATDAENDVLRLTLDNEVRTGARIKVVGVGGGGSNAVNRMVAAGLDGVEFIVVNTDLQALKLNAAPNKLQIGAKLTKGLGAGADPNVGRQAALEDTDKLMRRSTAPTWCLSRPAWAVGPEPVPPRSSRASRASWAR